jgi:uncharacterized protein YbjT (DUF2867 family)
LKIVVIGGTGLIGRKLVSLLRARGHDAVAASPSSGVNVITGEGLAEVLRGADATVDVSNAPSFDERAVLGFFDTAGRNLLEAGRRSGVRHHITLSVVGTDRLQASAYFRAKLAQENLVKASGIPYTIVRATQFFEFLGTMAASATDGQTVRLPDARIQPILSDDVAMALADIAIGEPRNATLEVAGPVAMRLEDAIRRYLKTVGDERIVTSDGQARYFGADLQDDTLIPRPGARLGATTFEAWLGQ